MEALRGLRVDKLREALPVSGACGDSRVRGSKCTTIMVHGGGAGGSKGYKWDVGVKRAGTRNASREKAAGVVRDARGTRFSEGHWGTGVLRGTRSMRDEV